MSIQHEINDWYLANMDEFIEAKYKCDFLTDLYIRDHPDCPRAWETVKKYVTRARAGKIRPSHNVDVEQIKANIATAREAFMPKSNIDVDLDPLGLNLNAIFFDVPETYASHLAPLKIEGVTTLGIASDIHFPIHNRQAVIACFGKLKELEIDGLYLNGDILDCASVGHHDKRKVLNYTWDLNVKLTLFQPF